MIVSLMVYCRGKKIKLRERKKKKKIGVEEKNGKGILVILEICRQCINKVSILK